MEDEELITKTEENSKASPLILIFIAIELSAIIACAVTLLYDSNDCENPVRTWIIITASILAFHSAFLAFFQRVQGKLAAITVAINTVVLSFLFLWMLTGFVWIYYDDECKDEFHNGFLLVLSLFGVYFGCILITVLFFAGVVLVVCVGAIFISSLMEDEEEKAL